MITLGDQLQHSNPLFSITDITDSRGGIRSVTTFDNSSLNAAFASIPDKLKTNYSLLLETSTSKIYYLSGSNTAATTTAAWTLLTSGASTISGTLNRVAKFTSGTTIGDSTIFDNGTSVGIGTITPNANAKLDILGSVIINPVATANSPFFTHVFTTISPFTQSAGNDADWTIVSGEAQSGSIPDRSKSSIEYTFNAATSVTTLSYTYRTSTEQDYDYLFVKVDGRIIKAYSGTIPTTTDSFNINGAGSHTIKFIYSKDYAIVAGTDTVWIDNVTLTSNVNNLTVNGASLFSDEIQASDITITGIASAKRFYADTGFEIFDSLGDRRATLSQSAIVFFDTINNLPGSSIIGRSLNLIQSADGVNPRDTYPTLNTGDLNPLIPGSYYIQSPSPLMQMHLGQYVGGDAPTGMLNVNGTSVFKDNITIVGPAIIGRETLLTAMVSDNATDKFLIANGTPTASRFIPTFVGYTSGAYGSLLFRGLGSSANDLSTTPAHISFLAANTNSSSDPNNGTFTAPTSRDLFTWSTPAADYMKMTASGRILMNTTIDNGFDRLQVDGYTYATGYRIPLGQSTWFLKADGTFDTNVYRTSNQTITLSGAVTGSGTTAITTTLANGVVGLANLSATGTKNSTTYLRGDNTWATITSGTTLSMGNIGVSSNVNGATISGSILSLTPADATNGGVITIGDQTFAGNKTFTDNIIIDDASQCLIRFSVSGSVKGYITSDATNYQFHSFNTNGFIFKYNNGVNPLELSNAGNATFLGSATATGFFNSSDARLKDVIERDGDTVKFTWKDKRDDKIHIGYIAQEVQEKYPDQVNESTDGLLTVNYIEVLVAKIQELENRIKQLEK